MSESEKTIQEECYGTCWGAQQRIDELTQQLNAANDRIKRLEESGDLMVQHFYTDEPRSEMWEKAKEYKP